jgi:endonuclease III
MTIHYHITKTVTKTDEVPAHKGEHTRIEVRTRKPEARAYTIDIPNAEMPNTGDVPSQFRSLVDSALTDACEQVLATFITTNAGASTVPCSLFSLEALLASSANKRMTSAILLGLWKSSSKYVLEIAPRLQEMTGSAKLRYAANVERHERRLTALTGKSPETALSAADLDKLLINLHDDDADTQLGQYLAERTEEIRAKLAEDTDAL